MQAPPRPIPRARNGSKEGVESFVGDRFEKLNADIPAVGFAQGRVDDLAFELMVGRVGRFELHDDQAAFGDGLAQEQADAAAGEVVDPGALKFLIVGGDDGAGGCGGAAIADGDSSIADALQSGFGKVGMPCHRVHPFPEGSRVAQAYVANGGKAKRRGKNKKVRKSGRQGGHPRGLHHVLKIVFRQFADEIAAQLPVVVLLDGMDHAGEQRSLVALFADDAEV
jgi:hypothetical protein